MTQNECDVRFPRHFRRNTPGSDRTSVLLHLFLSKETGVRIKERADGLQQNTANELDCSDLEIRTLQS